MVDLLELGFRGMMEVSFGLLPKSSYISSIYSGLEMSYSPFFACRLNRLSLTDAEKSASFSCSLSLVPIFRLCCFMVLYVCGSVTKLVEAVEVWR